MPSGSQRPRVHVAPRTTETYGDLAAKFAADYGLEPDAWQRFVLDDWLGTYGGRWAALTCGLSVSRQNGKNALLEMRELFGMVGLGERILHTAHEVKTAQKHFRRLKYFFGGQANDPGAKFPELNALVESVRSVNGQEAIFLKNGGSVELAARSKNSGRGFTVDVLVMDEAQEMSEDALEALMPTTSAAPLGNPQWIFTGTPPGPSASGEVFERVRNEAVGDRPGRLAWHEWSAPEGHVDLDDRDVWRATNPALDSGRLQIEVIEGERARFSEDGFGRERLGMWTAAAGASRAISAEQWSDSGVGSKPDGVKSFGVAFSFDGSRVALAGAVKHDDGVHVELVDAFEGSVESGLGNLAAWLAERWRDTAVIVIAGSAHAGVLAKLLTDLGVPSPMIQVASTQHYLQACAMTLEAVRAGTMTHLASDGQRQLDDSVAACDVDKRGGWAATTAGGDETPLEAVSVALWAAKTTKRRPRGAHERKAVFL